MTSITSFLQPQNYINAGMTTTYSAKLVDFDGTAIGSSSVSALTLSIIDTASGTVINTVNLKNILNTDRGTLDNAGNCVITLTPGDTALLVTTHTFEIRSLIIDWTYSATKTGRHRIDFGIVGVPGTQPD